MSERTRLCDRRHCGEEGLGYSGDGDFLCLDHLQDWQDEQTIFEQPDIAERRREFWLKRARAT